MPTATKARLQPRTKKFTLVIEKKIVIRTYAYVTVEAADRNDAWHQGAELTQDGQAKELKYAGPKSSITTYALDEVNERA